MNILSAEFLKEHGAAVGTGTAVILAVAVAAYLFSGGTEPVKKVPEVMMVKLQPLPPPPPPPPPPKMIEQPKMVEQTPVKMPEPKPDKPLDKPMDKPKADAPPPGPLALDAKAEGPSDAFNLGGKEGGTGILGGGGGSRWGWYASIVQMRIESALRANRKTRNAAARNEIRLWLDASGRVERAQLVSGTGDEEVDRAIENEVLPGLGFEQAPPRDMPMPVVVRLTARRPG